MGITVALIGLLFLAAAVGYIMTNGLAAALANGLPYLGIGLILLLAGRYLAG